jgi:hypothetical protein
MASACGAPHPNPPTFKGDGAHRARGTAVHPSRRNALRRARHDRGITAADSSYFGGSTAIASTSITAPGRASCGTPTVVLAGGAAVFTYRSRTSR